MDNEGVDRARREVYAPNRMVVRVGNEERLTVQVYPSGLEELRSRRTAVAVGPAGGTAKDGLYPPRLGVEAFDLVVIGVRDVDHPVAGGDAEGMLQLHLFSYAVGISVVKETPAAAGNGLDDTLKGPAPRPAPRLR